jgi:sialate O-acetylesterase
MQQEYTSMQPHFIKIAIMIIMLGVTITPAMTAIKPNSLFTDGAVLQQGIKIPVWGTANEGEKVTVTLGKQTVSTTTKDGKWLVYLNPLKAGGPYTMTISGENTIELKNILIGEVWICSGQSNMELQLISSANAETAIAESKDPKIRLFTVPVVMSRTPHTDTNSKWLECEPATSAGFSAVGYYFGRALRKALNVPIGLINASVGGTVIQAWTSSNTQKGLTKEDPGKPVTNPNLSNVLYNGMIAPLIPLAFRGAIWYQGESNENDAYAYRKDMPAMIHDWRNNWGQGDFPFLMVQLAPF